MVRMAAHVSIRPLVLASLLAALAPGTLACGKSDSGSTTDTGPFKGTIHIVDNAFSPASVTVAVGDSVTWRWEGSHQHTVTQGTTPDASQDPGRLFDSGLKTSGTFGYRFQSAGTFPYFCRVHFSAGMKGTVKVTS
jgi:plastocyanin